LLHALHFLISRIALSMKRNQIKQVPCGLQDERARGEKAAERVRAVKQWRADLAERQSAARELRVARNRFVLRAHERLMRDTNRQKDDDRSRRMDALKVCPSNA